MIEYHRTMKRRLLLTLSVIALIGASETASATVIEYTSEADFAAATTGISTYGFGGIVTAGFSASEPNLTVGPATFTSGGNGFVGVTLAGYFAGYSVPYYTAQTTNADNTVTITLTGDDTAIALDFGSYLYYRTEPDTIEFTLSTGDTFTLAEPEDPNTPEFVGFTSTVPITSIELTNLTSSEQADGARSIDLTGFEVGNAAAVPEPASLALFGGGLVGLRLLKRRKRKATK